MNIWINAGLVGLGGAAGAILRTGLSQWIYSFVDPARFAWGTLAVNLIGCLLIGMARAGVELADWGSAELRLVVFAGFLGAFTTFSTFEADIVTLWRAGNRLGAGFYLGLSVAGGLAAFLVGWYLIARLASPG